MSPASFRAMFEALHNMERSDLEKAGAVLPGDDGDAEWNRFNYNLTSFVLALPPDRLAALAKLVEDRTKETDLLDEARRLAVACKGLAKVAETLTGCRGDDDFVSGIQKQIQVFLARAGRTAETGEAA